MMLNNENKKLIIFDCDGVLFDSAQANVAYFKECLVKLNIKDVPVSIYEKVPYMSILQLFRELLMDDILAQQAFSISQTISYDPFLDELQPLFDFDRVLLTLNDRYFLALASNRGRSLKTLIDYFDLNQYFQYHISVLSAQAKPHPDMLLKCLERFNVMKEETVFIGDAVSDKQAAEAAGVEYISVGSDSSTNSIVNCRELLDIF